MIPGPDVVLACPHCGAAARLFTIESGDPAGATSWTDGYQEVPSMPRQPNATRCPACSKFYWLAEAQQLGWLMPGVEVPPGHAAWLAAPMVEPLDEAGYYDALASGLAQTPDQELELRVFAWWRANDRFRKTAGGFPLEERAVKNIERLVELCADGDHEVLLFRAEALRQLGRFDEATEALYGLCSDYAVAREKLSTLIAAQSRDLAVLFT